MTQTLTPAAPVRRRTAVPLYALLAAAGAAVALPFVSSLESSPRTTLTFVNQSDWDLEVELVLDDGRSRLPLARIGAQRTERIEEILDQGDGWRIRWWYAEDLGAEVARTERALRDDRFQVRAPGDLVERLRASGAPPSP